MTAKTANHRVVLACAGAPNTLLLATCKRAPLAKFLRKTVVTHSVTEIVISLILLGHIVSSPHALVLPMWQGKSLLCHFGLLQKSILC